MSPGTASHRPLNVPGCHLTGVMPIAKIIFIPIVIIVSMVDAAIRALIRTP